jgi:catechol 2,3-dioxygenase-like lactoylglutathione lyase family enzyme
MRRFHIALSVTDIEKSIAEYTERLRAKPVAIVPREYALWRTEALNFSIRRSEVGSEKLRHLGWEDDSAISFEMETDCNGIVWEQFSVAQQTEEIQTIWPS